MGVEVEQSRMETASLVGWATRGRGHEFAERATAAATDDAQMAETSALAACSPDKGCPVLVAGRGHGDDDEDYDDGDHSPFDDVDLRDSSPEAGARSSAVRSLQQAAWRHQTLWTLLTVMAIVTMVVGAAVALAVTTARSNRRSLALMRALRHWYATDDNGTRSPLEHGRIPLPANTGAPTIFADAANDTRPQFGLVFR
ncbi:hypothetical protein HPB51_002442 [Rhipicephalus microplus]|uniref:Uncharacterized protein n=1 Tax=Rhipicephalus microplus TaxID=6941 RepID=A0A9J6DEE8_RHIMP|nr:hypothetical protein HPB51_002442 [Rhipicephalus microplus]